MEERVCWGTGCAYTERRKEELQFADEQIIMQTAEPTQPLSSSPF